jgi:hypothetical protein
MVKFSRENKIEGNIQVKEPQTEIKGSALKKVKRTD